MEYDPIIQARGENAALHVFVAALLYVAMKAGPEGELLKRLIQEGERALVRVREEAETDDLRKVAEVAIAQYRDTILQLSANLSAKQTKN